VQEHGQFSLLQLVFTPANEWLKVDFVTLSYVNKGPFTRAGCPVAIIFWQP
jgi:hypothetical protein